MIIGEYKPILDFGLELVTIASRGEPVIVRVPYHHRAAGLAADLQTMALRFYPYTDSKIIANGDCRLIRGNPDPLPERRELVFVFERGYFPNFAYGPFEHTTTMENNGRKASGTAKSTTEKYLNADRTTPFIEALIRMNVPLPGKNQGITLHMAYDSVSDFAVHTYFQQFRYLDRFQKPQSGIEGLLFPVSKQPIHTTDSNTFDFFTNPIIWDNWSQLIGHALYKMAGMRNYNETAAEYSTGQGKITRRAEEAERVATALVSDMMSSGEPTHIGNMLNCPYEYFPFLTPKALSALRRLCTPQRLMTEFGTETLVKLSEALKDQGLSVDAVDLAHLFSQNRFK